MLTAFQSDNLLSSIVRVRIVKPDILDQATSPTHRLAYKEPANCLRPQKFDVGYGAGASMKELLGHSVSTQPMAPRCPSPILPKKFLKLLWLV